MNSVVLVKIQTFDTPNAIVEDFSWRIYNDCFVLLPKKKKIKKNEKK